MYEQPSSNNKGDLLWVEPQASDCEIVAPTEDLKAMIDHALTSWPKSSLGDDEFYCVGFTLLNLGEGEDMASATDYDYQGEFLECVEEGNELYVLFKDVCCHILPPEGQPYTPEATTYINRHELMKVPISGFSTFMISIDSKSATEAEYAQYRRPAESL